MTQRFLACALLLVAAAAQGASYKADPAQSKLGFTGVQAGADFTGVFRRFSAVVEFTPQELNRAHILVQIDLTSVDTMDKDRDSTIRGPDIFDIAHSPNARYETRSIVASAGGGFTGRGALTLRGVTKEVPIEFKFIETAQGARLVGSAQLKRLDFGAGQGDWKSTEWVADTVKVSFALALKKD